MYFKLYFNIHHDHNLLTSFILGKHKNKQNEKMKCTNTMLVYIYSLHKYHSKNAFCTMDYVRTQFVTIPNWYWVRMSNAQTIKFVERGCPRTRLTLKEKRFNLTFIDGLAPI